MFKRTTFAQERTYDAHDEERSSSQTPPPARPGPSRTPRYTTQRARSKQPAGANWQHENDYSMDADDFPMPIQAVNTHQLLDRLLTNAAVGITRGELGAANLHSSLLLIRTRLDSEASRAAEADARATSLLQRVQETMADMSSTRNELLTTRESLHLHEVQLAQARAEIQRAQRTIDALERARDDAEREAAEARTKARQAKLDHAVIVAREEGRRAGVEEGYRRGRTAGMHEGRQSARVNVRVADDSDYDTAEEDLSPTRSIVNNSVDSRGLPRPRSSKSEPNRPRRASEPGVVPPLTTANTNSASVLLRPMRKISKEDQLPSPVPIMVPATPPSPSVASGRSMNHPPRPASAPIRSILRQPTPSLPIQQATRDISPDSRSGTTGTSSTPHPVDSSHETTQTSTSRDESTAPQLQHPSPRKYTYAPGNQSLYVEQHLLPPSRTNILPETPNSLPPVTPISFEAAAPAIYSPFPVPPSASQQSQNVDQPPSIRSPPRAASPTAGKTRGKTSGSVSYDPAFSPWSLLHSPTVPEAMRAPIVVNTMRPSPISAPLSEIDLVTRAPPAINAAPSSESQTTQPMLRRLGTLRDLLEEPTIQIGSRRGTPTGEMRHSNERRSPLGPRSRQETDSRTRSPFDWLLRRSVRPSVRRAETSGTIPIAVHSPTETMTIPSQNRSPPGSTSQASPGFLSPEPQEQAQLWPPDPEALRAATVSAVSESPVLVNRPLVPDDNMRYAQASYNSDEGSPSRLISPLEMGSAHGPLGFLPMRTGPDYFASTLVRYPILRDSAQSPTQSDLGSQQTSYSGKRKRSSRSPASRTEYHEAPIPAGLVYPRSGSRTRY